MNWQLKKETGNTRVYISQHGTELTTTVILTDPVGRKWYGFTDFFKIPYIRTVYAKRITDLFQLGLTAGDIHEWIKEERELLKSNDPLKYEKLFALSLKKEELINAAIDPLKQHLALCTIYVLADDERIDYFSDEEAAAKMKAWELDKNIIAFFLSWQAEHMLSYTDSLKTLSQIVLNLGTAKKP